MTGPFRTLVFGGGGTRCFWHGGFMAVAGSRLPLDVRRVSAVSGGALSAAAWITNRERRLLDSMCEAFRGTARGDGNVNFDDLTNGDDPFPHERMYRRVVGNLLDDDAAMRSIAEGPEFRVRLARPGALGAYGTMAAYALDLKLRSTPHPRLPELTGARPLTVDARAAARDGALCELIVAAASAPPLFDRAEWDGATVMDGGVIDNAPPWAESEEPTLLLVTRPYDNLPERDNRLYASPSEKPPTFKLDFTDAEGIRAAWALGERDAEAFLARHFPEC